MATPGGQFSVRKKILAESEKESFGGGWRWHISPRTPQIPKDATDQPTELAALGETDPLEDRPNGVASED